jgi:hypothetical protein
MKTIYISNDSIFDKDHFKTFVYQDKYKSFGTSTSVPMYQELLREVIGNTVDTIFEDKLLSIEETQAIETIFSQQIDENIPFIETPKKLPFHKRLEWKNKGYDLNLSITSITNHKIKNFYTIVQICKECISENKKMYISIK